MEGYCSCGAKLPDDARFCHRCGKPQGDFTGYEEPEEPQPVAPPPLPIAVVPSPHEISFSNGPAVRIGFAAACVAWFLMSVLGQISPLFFLLSPAIAGFGAVRFYSSRMHENLSTLSGARMGWITGVFWFVISIVFFTLTMVSLQTTGAWDTLRDMLQKQGHTAADLDQFMSLLRSPDGMAELVVMFLLIFLLLATVLPALGGALGASIGRRQQNN